MNRRVFFAVVVLAALGSSAIPGAAQEMTAEVRTWSGQSWRLSQPSFEVFYTILPKEEGAGAPAAPAPTGPPAIQGPGRAGARGGRLGGLQMFGSMRTLSALFEPGPEPMQGHRQAEVVTIHQAGVARQIPLATIATLIFTREPVKDSSLPPYVAPTHFRYAVTAVLTDGSRIEGDYTNLGTAILRGMTPQGRVEIPWQDIEVVRFSR